MSQDNFAGGFIAGAFVGGLLGGIVGVLASDRLRRRDEESTFSQLSEDELRQLESATAEERMEIARRGLEDKIAQLNLAIEDVRNQVGSVHNGQPAVNFVDRAPQQPANGESQM